MRDLLADGRAKLVAVPWTDIVRVKLPFYWLDDIPAGTYPGQTAAVPTPSLRVLLVTTENAEAEAVYGLTRALVDNLPALQAAHPAARGLSTDTTACRHGPSTGRPCSTASETSSSRSPDRRRKRRPGRARLGGRGPALGLALLVVGCAATDIAERGLDFDGHGRSAAARAGQELVAPGALVGAGLRPFD